MKVSAHEESNCGSRLIILCNRNNFGIFHTRNRVEEVVVDGWNPIIPSILLSAKRYWRAFMALTPNGTFLESNISASDMVRILLPTGFISKYLVIKISISPCHNRRYVYSLMVFSSLDLTLPSLETLDEYHSRTIKTKKG